MIIKKILVSLALFSAVLGIGLPSAMAHDFGDAAEILKSQPPGKPGPCGRCGCGGPGGGDNGSPDPPNRTQKPISFRDGGEGLLDTDLDVVGEFPILVVRSYDSQSSHDSALGASWAFTLSRSLYEFSDGSIVVRHGCGSRDRYVLSGGAYVSPSDGMKGTLTAVSGGYELRYINGITDHFDNLGLLTSVRDKSGNRHEYTYDARGKLPLVGVAKASVDPTQPIVIAYVHRLTRIDERSANGQLTGQFVTFQYNESTGRLVSVTSNDGRSVSYSHDTLGVLTKGNLVQVNALSGRTISYGYTDPYDPHNLTSISDAAGRTPVVNTYDVNDRVVLQIEGSRKIQFDYQVPGVRTVVTRTIVDANGANPYNTVTTYEFDVSGRVSRIVTPLGHEERYIYNSSALLTRKEIWQKDGASLSLLQAKNWTYDTSGHKLTESVTLDGGETVTRSWTYEGEWVKSEQVTSSANPSKVFRTESLFNYGADGRAVSVQSQRRRKDDGSFASVSYLYDERNRLTATTYPGGIRKVNEYIGDHIAHSYYEVAGTPISHMDERFEFDGEGQLSKHWDGNNNLTQLSYDDDGRLTARTNAIGEQEIWTYTNDRLTQVERGRTASGGEGQVGRYLLDARGRLTQIQRKNDAGIFVAYLAFTYDSEDRRLSVTDANSRTSTLTYDLNGRVSSVTDPLGKVTQYFFDAANNRTRTRDALQRDIEIQYDDLNRIIAATEKGVTPNARTEYTYDAAGNLTSVKDPENRVTAFEFDALSRNTKIVKPLGQEAIYSYDDLDRLITTNTPRGQKLVFSYEAWGVIREEKQFATTAAVNPDRVLTYGFDNAGNVSSVFDTGIQSGPSILRSFDPLNRLYDETIKYLPGGDRVIQRRYDRFGNRSELNVVGSGAFNNSYVSNKQSQLTNATLAGASISLSYLQSGELQAINFPNGVIASSSYKQNGPIDQLQIANANGVIALFTHTYDDALNIASMSDFDGLHSYAHDGANRLVGAAHPAASGLPLSESFVYSGTGDRKDSANSAAWTYDANHRISTSPGLTYSFDAAGNMLSRSDSLSLVHDARQRLISITKSGVTTTYLHDAFGRRLRKTTGGVSVWYLWDESQLIAEIDDSGNRVKRYSYLFGATPAQIEDANGTYYVHSDSLFAPRLLTNSMGQVVWRSRFQVYGSAVLEQDVDANGVPVIFNMRFPGQYYDAEAGLHYNYFRDYDPAIGRFIQSDPIGFAGGLNYYSYAGGQPLSYIDPLGLAAVCTETFNSFTEEDKQFIEDPAPTYSQVYYSFRPGNRTSAEPGYDFPYGRGGRGGRGSSGGFNLGLSVEWEMWEVQDKTETHISGYLIRYKRWTDYFCREKKPCQPEKTWSRVEEGEWGPFEDHTKTETYTETLWLRRVGSLMPQLWQTPSVPARR